MIASQLLNLLNYGLKKAWVDIGVNQRLLDDPKVATTCKHLQTNSGASGITSQLAPAFNHLSSSHS